MLSTGTPVRSLTLNGGFDNVAYISHSRAAVRIQDIGGEIRKAREGRGLTQAQLAREAGLSRETLNLLENGLLRDLGIRKILAVLEHLGLELTLQQASPTRQPDFLQMACTTANVSFRSTLTENELIHALMTGKVPARRAPHLRALLGEAPEPLLRGLVQEAARWARPGKVERNIRKLVQALGVPRNIGQWFKTA
jgi:transcriptional regulator with XRE-family HTH domain